MVPTVLASLGTIVAFFSVSTTSYPFMILLNVAVFTVSGVLGLRFLLQTLHRLTLAVEEGERTAPVVPVVQDTPAEVEIPKVESPSGEPPFGGVTFSSTRRTPLPGALSHLSARPVGRHVKIVFRIWLIVFALVGAQMGWVLRPFIGNPKMEFTWLRPRESNFFEAVLKTTGKLLGFNDSRHNRWSE